MQLVQHLFSKLWTLAHASEVVPWIKMTSSFVMLMSSPHAVHAHASIFLPELYSKVANTLENLELSGKVEDHRQLDFRVLRNLTSLNLLGGIARCMYNNEEHTKQLLSHSFVWW